MCIILCQSFSAHKGLSTLLCKKCHKAPSSVVLKTGTWDTRIGTFLCQPAVNPTIMVRAQTSQSFYEEASLPLARRQWSVAELPGS